jgi:hypothetical protein
VSAFLRKKQTGGPYEGKTNAYILGQLILEILFAFKFAAPGIYNKIGGDDVYKTMKRSFVPKGKKAPKVEEPEEEGGDSEEDESDEG